MSKMYWEPKNESQHRLAAYLEMIRQEANVKEVTMDFDQGRILIWDGEELYVGVIP